MNRREALRLLATGAALPLAAPKLLALREARLVLADTATGPRTMNPHQFATSKAMVELILPRTDTPGASDVGTAEFIDLMLTEWYGDEEKAEFLKGFTDVDARAQSLFANMFLHCTSSQQSELLIELGEKMIEDMDATGNVRHHRRGSDVTRSRHFYPMLRHLTLTAYYTSEAGATSELHFEIIPAHFDGCAPISGKEGSNTQ